MSIRPPTNADVYEYPVTIFSYENQICLAHCPEHYNVIEVENIETGKRLFKGNRPDIDFFQSRLQMSPNQKFLLSAGWIWHPVDSFLIYDLSDDISSPKIFDPNDLRREDIGLWEISEAVFIDDKYLLLSGYVDQDEDKGVGMVVFDLNAEKLISKSLLTESTGKLMPVDSMHTVSFYGYPKLINIQTGEIVQRWNDISVHRQNGSINTSATFTPIAIDPLNKRFAVATENSIEVVELSQ